MKFTPPSWKAQGLFWAIFLISVFSVGCTPAGESKTGVHIVGDNNTVCLEQLASEDDVVGAPTGCGNPSTITNPEPAPPVSESSPEPEAPPAE